MEKYEYSDSDRPDKKDVALARVMNQKKVNLQKSLSKIKAARITHMFSAGPDGMPVQGVSSGTGIHVIWHCSVNGKNIPSEGLTVAEMLQVVITRLQYIQQSTELAYPVNDEVLIHLFNALVLLQNNPETRENQGLIDIREQY